MANDNNFNSDNRLRFNSHTGRLSIEIEKILFIKGERSYSRIYLDGETKKILLFIESRYLTICNMTDIANYIGVTENTITREFHKYNLCSPKRLLMYFKVKHSIELLRNSDLKIREIANLSGFTNEQRYIECFAKVFHSTPSNYRRTFNIDKNNQM